MILAKKQTCVVAVHLEPDHARVGTQVTLTPENIGRIVTAAA